MISFVGHSNMTIQHFRGLSTDISKGDHLPNTNGVMECTGLKLVNGDELATIDTQEVYVYDEENKKWWQW